MHVPMDEALTRVAIDISGRPFLVFKAEFVCYKVGTFDTELVEENRSAPPLAADLAAADPAGRRSAGDRIVAVILSEIQRMTLSKVERCPLIPYTRHRPL